MCQGCYQLAYKINTRKLSGASLLLLHKSPCESSVCVSAPPDPGNPSPPVGPARAAHRRVQGIIASSSLSDAICSDDRTVGEHILVKPSPEPRR